MKKKMNKLATAMTVAALLPLSAMAAERGRGGSFEDLTGDARTDAYVNLAGGTAADISAMIAKAKFSEELKTKIEKLQDQALKVKSEMDQITIEKAIIQDGEETRVKTTTIESKMEGRETKLAQTMSSKESQSVHHAVDTKMQLKKAELAAIENKITNLRMTVLSRVVESGYKLVRKGSTLLILADAGSRVYIWGSLHKNPTFSPVLTYTVDKVGELIQSNGN